jgi:ribose transport system substrate-binding protein
LGDAMDGRMHAIRRWFTASVLAAPVLMIAACSNSSPGTSAGSTTSVPPASAVTAGGNLAAARATVSQYSAVPAFTAPGPPIDASSARGKTVLIVDGAPLAFDTEEDSGVLSAVKAASMKASVYDTSGTSTSWAQGVEQGISQHVAAIVLTGPINPDLIKPTIELALEAHIVVLSMDLTDTPQQQWPYVSGTAQPYIPGVTALAAAAVVDAHGAPIHDLYIESKEIGSLNQVVLDAYTAAFQRFCGPQCTITVVNADPADWSGSALQSIISSALLSNPDINAVTPIFDAMITGATPAIAQANSSGKHLMMFTLGGTNSVVRSMTSTGNLVAADVGAKPEWLAYSGVDQMLRKLLGDKAVTANATPTRLFLPSNAAQAADVSGGYGSSYISGYEKLWGVG